MGLEPRDRLAAVENSTTFNGIDFVEILSADQRTLRVHFLNNKVAVAGTITGLPTIAGGETIRTVAPIAASLAWTTDTAGRPLLTFNVPAPGDFSIYTLALPSPALDPYFSKVNFSFKAGCPSDLDCCPPSAPCPPDTVDAPPIDYTAKDFMGFRQALSDFSALRYPNWLERSEADFGMMFMEALCSLGDDLSYTQDRIAAEATLSTATQRVSLVRQARLVDYEPRAPLSAGVWLQFNVTIGPIPSGLLVSAQSPDGTPIYFETGNGLGDNSTFPADSRWNRASDISPGQISPYWFDDRDRCLAIGATQMWIEGSETGLSPGIKILIDTAAATSADPPIREMVTLTLVQTGHDALLNVDYTLLEWDASEALKYNHDLTNTEVVGNLAPATQGRRYAESFMIEPAPTAAGLAVRNPGDPPYAIYRDGPTPILSAASCCATCGCDSAPSPAPQFLYTLLNGPLTCLWPTPDDPETFPVPEIQLTQPGGTDPQWTWLRLLLDADQFQQAYTVDPGRFSMVNRNSDGSFSLDYDGDSGDTIRFGTGDFGQVPGDGAVFRVTYRIGAGAAGNVAADTITRVESNGLPGAAVTNPFAATSGADAETAAQVRNNAPQAFRAQQYRAVRPEDYAAAAETFPWVKRAGTRFRWTGSWLTVFTTADPIGAETLSVDQHEQLIELLNRRRMAGYESYVPDPQFVSLDLKITVCALTTAFNGDVEADLLAALGSGVLPNGTLGFFNQDRWVFGQPLERSALEAAIQIVAGVAGVVRVRYRQRGLFTKFAPLPPVLQVGVNQVLRVDNDPSRPEAGTLQFTVEGGQ